MNKYKEALKGAIERSNAMSNCCGFVGKCLRSDECEFNDDKLMCEDYVCFRTLQELVEKATPKNVKVIDRNYDFYVCPTCFEFVGYTEELEDDRYCLNCGQALDWSE